MKPNKLTPAQIRAEKEALRRQDRTIELQQHFKREAKFNLLPDETVELYKTILLADMGYDPQKPIIKQDLPIRIIYHSDREKLATKPAVLRWFENRGIFD